MEKTSSCYYNMNILLIGNGAREHCIAEALAKNGRVKVFSFIKAKNPGIVAISEGSGGSWQLGSYTDFKGILDFAKKVKPDFAVIGPDDPIADGVADLLLEFEIHSVAPLKTVARLESSKSFTRDLVQKYNIPGNPQFKVFYEESGVQEFMEKLGGNFVVKADGLMGGKGVQVSGDHLKTIAEGVEYAQKCIEKFGRVVVEEKLIGQEFSLMSFVDGKHVVDMPPVQDHKRAFMGDLGPNCYSEDTEVLTKEGWKKFNALNKDDEVMTFNHKTSLLNFEKPKKIYWMPYKGKMFYFKHRTVDLLVTPNHRMLFEQRKENKKRFVLEAQAYKGEHCILQGGKWRGKDLKYFELPELDYKFNRKILAKKIPFDIWSKFLSIYLAEGYVAKEKNALRIYICQTSHSQHLKKIKEILEAMPYVVSYEKNNKKFRINSTQLGKALLHFGHSYEKFVPSYVKEATPKIIKQFLEAFCLGDGDIHNGNMRLCSSSKRMMDDFQELILKLGYSSIIYTDKRRTMVSPLNKKVYPAGPIYSLEVKKRNKVSIRKELNHYGTVNNYNGHVGCVTVSTGFVVIRRNHRVSISGNTGGMGSYSDANHSLPFLQKSDLEAAHAITESVADALFRETGVLYKGIMYGGFMAVSDGVRLIEYNARFGDPEVMNVLPIMKTDFVSVCEAILAGRLDALNVEFEKKATVCKYIVPEGYPEHPRAGERIVVEDQKSKIKNKNENSKIKMYYASVDERDGELYVSLSRAVAFVGIADTLPEAEKIVETACGSIKGLVFHREDIGTPALIAKRIFMMKELRKQQ